MRITHINTYDIRGGAARAAYRLHLGLRKIGHDSRMLVLQKDSSDPSVDQFTIRRDLMSRIRRKALRTLHARLQKPLQQRPAGAPYFSDDRSEYGAEALRQTQCDVLHLHWIAGMLDYRAFFSRVPGSLPLVWTLHDMNPFTGGCHYDGGCGKFTRQCGACPQIFSSKPSDFSWHSWNRKKTAFEALRDKRFYIVTPSRWLKAEVERSALLARFPVIAVPNGLDTNIFQPRKRASARERFALPLEARIVLFVADWADEKRKGLDLLLGAIRGIRNVPDFRVVTVGRRMPNKQVAEQLVAFDYIRDEVTMSQLYSAADVFVIPSLQDNFPNTGLEALACGVPVVAFAAGGVPEIVRNDMTGYTVPAGDSQALAEAIKVLLHDDERRAGLSHNCRRIALQEYSLEVQAKRYIQLYEELREKRMAARKSEE